MKKIPLYIWLFFFNAVKQECVVVLVIIFFMTPSPQSQRIGKKMEVTMLLIHVVMQVCALHTEAGFRMECLVLNIKGTYFLNDNFHWIFFLFAVHKWGFCCLSGCVSTHRIWKGSICWIIWDISMLGLCRITYFAPWSPEYVSRLLQKGDWQ